MEKTTEYSHGLYCTRCKIAQNKLIMAKKCRASGKTVAHEEFDLRNAPELTYSKKLSPFSVGHYIFTAVAAPLLIIFLRKMPGAEIIWEILVLLMLAGFVFIDPYGGISVKISQFSDGQYCEFVFKVSSEEDYDVIKITLDDAVIYAVMSGFNKEKAEKEKAAEIRITAEAGVTEATLIIARADAEFFDENGKLKSEVGF